MKKEELKYGDVVIVTSHNRQIYEAILIGHGDNLQPLVVRVVDLKNGVYIPIQITYNEIVKVSGHINIKNALLREYDSR